MFLSPHSKSLGNRANFDEFIRSPLPGSRLPSAAAEGEGNGNDSRRRTPSSSSPHLHLQTPSAKRKHALLSSSNSSSSSTPSRFRMDQSTPDNIDAHDNDPEDEVDDEEDIIGIASQRPAKRLPLQTTRNKSKDLGLETIVPKVRATGRSSKKCPESWMDSNVAAAATTTTTPISSKAGFMAGSATRQSRMPLNSLNIGGDMINSDVSGGGGGGSGGGSGSGNSNSNNKITGEVNVLLSNLEATLQHNASPNLVQVLSRVGSDCSVQQHQQSQGQHRSDLTGWAENVNKKTKKDAEMPASSSPVKRLRQTTLLDMQEKKKKICGDSTLSPSASVSSSSSQSQPLPAACLPLSQSRYSNNAEAKEEEEKEEEKGETLNDNVANEDSSKNINVEDYFCDGDDASLVDVWKENDSAEQPIITRQDTSQDHHQHPPHQQRLSALPHASPTNNHQTSQGRSLRRCPSSQEYRQVPDFSQPRENNVEPLGTMASEQIPLTTFYQRSLVLEVKIDTDPATKKARKVLRVIRQADGVEGIVYLQGSWIHSDVNCGDVVNVCGGFSKETHSVVIDSKNDNLLILHPDLLISAVNVSSGFRCQRKTILKSKIQDFQSDNHQACLGTMAHKLFQRTLGNPGGGEELWDAIIRDIIAENAAELYGNKITEQEALKSLEVIKQRTKEWLDKYTKDCSPLDKPMCSAAALSPELMKVTQVLDIEQTIWSPRYGLKGALDACVDVELRDAATNTSNTVTVPMELKSASDKAKDEHTAQVMLYNLLLEEYLSKKVMGGLLVYIREGKTLGIPQVWQHIQELISTRNNLASSMNKLELPAMSRDQHRCHTCYEKANCMILHKAIEHGTADTSGTAEIFNSMTCGLTQTHLDYINHWEALLRLEEKDSGTSNRDLWNKAAWEREKEGRCISSLVVTSFLPVSTGFHYQLTRVTEFQTIEDEENNNSSSSGSSKEGTLPEHSLTMGDKVSLSTNNGHISVASGVIKEIGPNYVVVAMTSALRDPGTRALVNNESKGTDAWNTRWIIDNEPNYINVKMARSNLLKMFAPEGKSHLRDLVVDLKPPRFVQLEDTDLADIEDIEGLNNDQRQALIKVLQAEDYALILGMPGTGKTSTTAHIIAALVKRNKSVLLSSYTHSAVDTMLLKLRDIGVTDFLRVGRLPQIHESLHSATLELQEGCTTIDGVARVVEKASIVATTCLGLKNPLISRRTFDVCIVDEASQIHQLQCLGPLMLTTKFVLVGDHYQLAPLVKNVEAASNGAAESLFRRLCQAHPEAVVELQLQYRMNADINRLVNTLIYNDRLRCGTSSVAMKSLTLDMELLAVEEHSWIRECLKPERRVVFIDTNDVDECRDTHKDKASVNYGEAMVVSEIVNAMVRCGVSAESVGVISPYRAQLATIKDTMEHSKVEVSTVDRFQGRDKGCIIMSWVRSNTNNLIGDLLRDWRRTNVAITRAEKKLIMVGRCTTLKNDPLMHDLIQFCKEQGWIVPLTTLPRRRQQQETTTAAAAATTTTSETTATEITITEQLP